MKELFFRVFLPVILIILFFVSTHYAAKQHHKERQEIEMIKSRIKTLENSACNK